jgi:adenine phosphoribosyltransferase
VSKNIETLIRTIIDYPRKGVFFRDVTPLLEDASGLQATIEQMIAPLAELKITKVAGIEARGFVLGGAIAHRLGVGFVPIRKKGKLPFDVLSQDYDLEYGSDTLEMHIDSISPGEHIVIIDDLLATGGTVEAAINLVQRSGGEVVACSFVVDLPELGGREKLLANAIQVFCLCEFSGH